MVLRLPLSTGCRAYYSVSDNSLIQPLHRQANTKGTVDAQAVELLREGSERHFDARLVEPFSGRLPEVLKVKMRWAEEQGGAQA